MKELEYHQLSYFYKILFMEHKVKTLVKLSSTAKHKI